MDYGGDRRYIQQPFVSTELILSFSPKKFGSSVESVNKKFEKMKGLK